VERSLKALVKIVLGGFVVFMVLSIVQEWGYFSSAWFGEPATETALAEEDKKSATEAIRLTLTLMAHLHASGGDPRFAERIPASDGVVAEMMADVEYVKRNHRRQDMTLEDLEVLSAETVGTSRVEVVTRESWRVGYQVIGTDAVEPTRQHVTRGRYLVVRDQTGWRVAGWAVDPEGQDGGEAS
jgi:hypothetical protein